MLQGRWHICGHERLLQRRQDQSISRQSTPQVPRFFFKKNGPTPASFSFIFGLFNQTLLQFLQQIYVEKCPSSIGAGIWTHDLRNVSLFPLPLDQGSCPWYLEFTLEYFVHFWSYEICQKLTYVRVTRLGYFWKVILEKNTHMFGNFSGNLKNIDFQLKLFWLFCST